MTSSGARAMATCAQTNLQLYNQLYDAGWSAADLAAARTVYELDVQLFAGRFRPNGKPFVAHLVGVASLVERFGLPPATVLAALAHAAYAQGNFADSPGGRCAERRARVRAAAGTDAERIAESYDRYKQGAGMPDAAGRLRLGKEIDETERQVLAIDLANTLEEYLDYGHLYSRKLEVRTEAGFQQQDTVQLAQLLGLPVLAQELEAASALTASAQRPPELVTDQVQSFTVSGRSSRPARWLRRRIAGRLRRLLAPVISSSG